MKATIRRGRSTGLHELGGSGRDCAATARGIGRRRQPPSTGASGATSSRDQQFVAALSEWLQCGVASPEAKCRLGSAAAGRGVDEVSWTGEHDPQPLALTLRDDDGNVYRVTRNAARTAGSLERVAASLGCRDATIESVVVHRRAGRRRRLHLDGDRRVVRFEADGDLDGVESLCQYIISRRSLPRAIEARFRWSGTTAAPAGEILCKCIGMTVAEADSLSPSQLAASGAASVCGGCRPEFAARCQSAVPAARSTEGVMPAPSPAATPRQVADMPYREFVAGVLRGDVQLPRAADIAARLRATAPGLFQPSNARATVLVVWLIARLAGAGLAIGYSATHGWYLAMIVAWVVQALNLYACLAAAHDFAHDLGFANRRWNSVFGTLLASTYLHRFHCFRASHREHHEFNQSFDDPKAAGSSVLKAAPYFYQKLWERAPVAAQNALIAACAVPVGAIMFLTSYEFSPLRRLRSWADAVDVLTICSVAGICVLTLGWGLAGIVLLPPILLAYGLHSIAFLTHVHEATLCAKRVEPIDFELMCFNINNLTLGRLLDWFVLPHHRYHVEHHLVPTVPLHRLRDVSRWVQAEYGHFMLPVRPVTLRYMRRGLVDRMSQLTDTEIAGRWFRVGPRFDSARVGDPAGDSSQ